MKKYISSGFGLVPVIVILSIVGILVFAGARINISQKSNDSNPTSNQTLRMDNAIKNTQDLGSVSKELDTVDVDSELQTSDLDNDINLVL